MSPQPISIFPNVIHSRPIRSPTPGVDAELERQIMERYFALGDERDPQYFPALHNISGAFMYRFMLRPRTPRPPEYVYVPVPDGQPRDSEAFLRVANFIATWNYAWEAGHVRHEMKDESRPSELAWLDRYRGHNLCLIADVGQRTRYDVYRPLYHLLPLGTLERYDLPALKRGNWPFTVSDWWPDRILPADADRRLALAFAAHIWPFLSPGSSIDKFSTDYPIKLLAHNLDFWVPHIDQVAQLRMSAFPRVEIDDEQQARLLARARAEVDDDLEIHRPLKGGYVWPGQAEAEEATRQLVEAADAHGRLRGILDAVRSNRVEEDFSARWSFAREDFERKLYSKRSRVKVSFVELDDTIPVHGPESEVDDNLLWEDLLGLLNTKERHIVVCLRSGITRVSEIARDLGYANHSPVSKALSRIRRKAKQLLDL